MTDFEAEQSPTSRFLANNSFYTELVEELERNPITKAPDNIMPAGIFTLRRLWAPLQGDIFDGHSPSRLIAPDDPPLALSNIGLTLLGRSAMHRLVTVPEHLKPTQKTMHSCAEILPEELTVRAIQADVINTRRSFSGKYFVGLTLSRNSRKAVRGEQARILRELGAGNMREWQRPHISLYATEDFLQAKHISGSLQRLVEFPGWLTLGRPRPAKIG